MALTHITRRLAASAAAGLVLATMIVLVDGAPAAAAPTLHVSKTTGLADGEQITVYGTGFTKNLQQIALGQCIKNPKGPTDCNLSGGSQFTNADANGKTPTLTLKMAKEFSGHKCAGGGCVIAAQILPSTASEDVVNANKASVPITFGTGSTKTPTPTATTSPAAGATTGSTSAAGDDNLPTTGPGLQWATILLIGAAFLLPGIGLIAVLPARRRRIAQLR
ncbi:neocarzinostatin apoprotein domain-containing protein [Amorphoplanes digitatis]|uniref:Neocarzinostatin family protein n=1 Tax=Actinoplanes digitatis TaxID=1868 RepID=A0A7W7MPM8_9ACTN|nr:neocarzinostatin apoprotein domain-containing protein [Actinoplanes digitatis]MBB4761690.1 hypothetical protein [Actinoplanes digitatis]GID90800.1 hypothetical protein Adi01nite_02120 [Actinoplanes digitatis]